MIYAEAIEKLRSGRVVHSGKYAYRMTNGVIERLNGWWEILKWPFDASELRSDKWVEMCRNDSGSFTRLIEG